MAVKTFCSICDRPIGKITGDALRTLTGREICEECGGHLQGLREGMEKAKDAFFGEIEKYKKDARAKYDGIMADLEKIKDRCNSLYSTRQAEIDNRLKDLIT